MERLDLRLVEYFVTVAEELHFGRAAERLHIAQPSLSQQVRRLERQLGVALLVRTSRSVALTPAGRVLLEEGRRLLADTRRVLQATRRAEVEPLSVGFYGSAGVSLLPALVRSFSDDHPQADISLRELRFGRLQELTSGEVDVAFTRLLPGQVDAGLQVEILAHDRRLAALPEGHRLAGHGSLRFTDLREERFITNPAVAEVGPTRWRAEQLRHGLPARIGATATSVPEILMLVAAGRGVSLVPATVAESCPQVGISYVEVRDADPAVVSLAWATTGADRRIVRDFVTAAREHARSPTPQADTGLDAAA